MIACSRSILWHLKTKAFGVSCARFYTLKFDIPELFFSKLLNTVKTKTQKHTHRERTERNCQASKEFVSANIEAGKIRRRKYLTQLLPNLLLINNIFPLKEQNAMKVSQLFLLFRRFMAMRISPLFWFSVGWWHPPWKRNLLTSPGGLGLWRSPNNRVRPVQGGSS